MFSDTSQVPSQVSSVVPAVSATDYFVNPVPTSEVPYQPKWINDGPIESWENQYPARAYTIRIDIPEFTSVCPKTGLPDFGTIIIEYEPVEWCLELKALKYYILTYRNMGIFYENVVNRILDDVVASCHPKWAKVEGQFSARGGISSFIKAEYSQPV